ncbi:hypothetical protein [Anatilimnocola floriformis]|uniref:hypothetical protein n=1 Tax=Anatilimnocola floriformis TaxID=2948575 RepID=UPI0020C253BD|nr:hypothetical protein [Anatilimnocola floriformis]
MTTLILDTEFEAQAIAQRRKLGLDRFDEVWDGVYIMAPLANNEHQFVSFELAHFLRVVCEGTGAAVMAGCNVSDQEADWKSNPMSPFISVQILRRTY